jgi:uncharacterized repeat protein (TIGR01451 family)
MWLARLRRLVNGNSRTTQGKHSRHRRRIKPRLDYLEDRTLLTTYTPTLFTDGVSASGVNTLRDAIIAANNDPGTTTDTIQLSAGTYTLSIANTSGHENAAKQGDLNITNTSHTLIIQGATDPITGKPTSIIDQTAADRVFQIVNPGTTVIFKNLVIEGGNTQDNGTAGAAAGSTIAEGGGLLNNGGNVTMTNVTIKADFALGGAGQSAQGGGIYSVNGTLTLNNVALKADAAFGGSNGGNAQGAGLYLSGGTANLTSCHISANSLLGGTGAPGGSGGNAQGGGIYSNAATLTLTGGSVNGNMAIAGIGGNGITGAQGQNGGVGGAGGLAQGGGVYVNGGQLTITGTAVTNSTLTGGIGGNGGIGGKAAVNASAGAIGGNGGAGGEADGGGVYALGAPVTINSGATVNTNTVTGGLGGHGGAGGAGASGNQNGGAGGAGGAGGLAQGGGIFASGSALAVALGNSTTTATVNANTTTGGAAGNGGVGGAKATGGTGVGGAGGAAGAGGSATGGGATISGDNLTLTNAIFSGDDAIGGKAGHGGTGKSGGAGAAGGMGGSAQGGGLYAVSSTLSALNATIADNLDVAGTQGINAAGQNNGVGGAGQGAGIYAATGSLTLTNDTIAWNFLQAFTDRGAPQGQGAGVYNASNNTLSLVNTIIATDEVFSSSTAKTTRTFYSDLYGTAASSNHDLIGDGTGATLSSSTGDQIGTDASPINPQFLPATTTNPATGLSGQVPGNYGGLTPTLALNWTSPAINGGDPSAAATIASAEGIATSSATDQRGFARVLDSSIDIGATETQLNIANSAPSSVQAGQTLTFTVTVTNGETTAIGVTLSDPLPTNTTFQSFSAPAGWTFIAPAVGQAGTVTASNSSLAANSTATFTLVVNVSASAQGGTVLTNTATLSTSGVNPTFSRSDTAVPTVAGSATSNITNEIGIKILHAHPDPDSGPGVFEQMVMLVNNSGTTLTGRIALVLTGLPAGVTLLNPSGTYNGSPYIDIVPDGGSWQAGQPHFLMPRLEFSDPSGVPITWTAEMIQGI